MSWLHGKPPYRDNFCRSTISIVNRHQEKCALQATVINLFETYITKNQLNSLILRVENVVGWQVLNYMNKLMKGYLTSNYILKYFVVFESLHFQKVFRIQVQCVIKML